MNTHAFAAGITFTRDNASPEAATLWHHFQNNSTISSDCFLGNQAYCHSTHENLVIGSRSVIRGILRCENKGRIDIASDVYLGDDTIVYARFSVRIGARSMIAHGVQIFDNDAHPSDSSERFDDYRRLLEGRPRVAAIPSAAIEIGEDCWIGMNSIILKGASIGVKAIVAAGSVVTKSIPAGTMVAGNPALPIGKSA